MNGFARNSCKQQVVVIVVAIGAVAAVAAAVSFVAIVVVVVAAVVVADDVAAVVVDRRKKNVCKYLASKVFVDLHNSIRRQKPKLQLLRSAHILFLPSCRLFKKDLCTCELFSLVSVSFFLTNPNHFKCLSCY